MTQEVSKKLDVDTEHGELLEYTRKGFLGLPVRRARRVDCGHNPSDCPFRVNRRSGPTICNITPNNSPVYHNLVKTPDGQYTTWRPAEIDCGKDTTSEKNNGQTTEDPLLRFLKNVLVRLPSLNLYKYQAFQL